MATSENILIVFCKAPIPGEVKTRLARDIGPEKAAALYIRLARQTIAQARTLTDTALRLYYTPTDRRQQVETLLTDDCELFPQSEGDLGARMLTAFRDVFQSGANRAVIIGTDCPALRSEHLRAAFDALDQHDLVIGPAHDGGYYLLGMKQPLPDLFTDIPWSTPDVLPRTLQQAEKLGCSVHQLETLRDVDTAGDLDGLDD